MIAESKEYEKGLCSLCVKKEKCKDKPEYGWLVRCPHFWGRKEKKTGGDNT